MTNHANDLMQNGLGEALYGNVRGIGPSIQSAASCGASSGHLRSEKGRFEHLKKLLLGNRRFNVIGAFLRPFRSLKQRKRNTARCRKCRRLQQPNPLFIHCQGNQKHQQPHQPILNHVVNCVSGVLRDARGVFN
jgi:hypothetical protein